MSDTGERGDAAPRLRERIDELATRLVLDEAGGRLAAELVQLSELAAGEGCPETARVAAELAKKTRGGGKGKKKAAAVAELLRGGIAQLQQVLDDEARKAASAPPEPAQKEPQPSVASSLAQDPELVRDFVLEAQEHLASIERRLLDLEQDPANKEAIHSVFRGFHTIKGLAGFLDFSVIQEVSHEVETLLDLVRNARLAINGAVVDLVLESADFLKQAIAAVEASLTGKTPEAVSDHSRLLAKIRELAAQAGPGQEQTPEENRAGVAPAPSAAGALPSGSVPEAAPQAERSSKAGAQAAESFSVRVDTSKLDYLMDMVGEMVIAQSIIRHNPKLASIQDSRLQGDLSQLARITGEVQRTTMSMRMLPIGTLFHRMARLVRDLSRKAGKQAELETSGEDTELDKTIAEELADPLMHMVRNAIDHGVEPPDERVAAGKSPTARVRLSASHQGGQIVVEVADDGRGLDREKILNKAQQRGLVQEGAQLTESEVFHLIFEPGFSTAEQVTDMSGRGVGMDVVRKHVQKLRGRIEVQSRAGQGTTFFIRLPLTLAIIEGLVVAVGSQRYIVPIFAVREMFRPTPEALATVQGRSEMAMVRGRLLPVVRLYKSFGVRPRSEDPCEGLLVVAECEGRPYCLLVDDLIGKQEVVIKSLGESLKNITGIAGGAILGDGRVGLILDMDGVFRGAGRG
jgi:two-component system chemotaxis sensor kinase CheA